MGSPAREWLSSALRYYATLALAAGTAVWIADAGGAWPVLVTGPFLILPWVVFKKSDS